MRSGPALHGAVGSLGPGFGLMVDFLFFLFAAGSVLGSLFVITRRNPVTSIMFLVLVFFCLSGMFLLLDAQFIAALQVILYAGAIMVLFLFVVMLLNLGHAAWDDVRRPLGRFGAGAAGLALLATSVKLLLARGEAWAPGTAGTNPVREAAAREGVIRVVAESLFRDHIVVFEVTGLLLLASMVGTIVLARRQGP
ncbi:MAG: NADH-quinone oxidoreductase subunit J [Gemmatimonadota bacterium]